MYTRCPNCLTCFRVTDRHLSIAKGKVRCGQCQLVFSAPEHAIDNLPVKKASTPQARKKTTAKKENVIRKAKKTTVKKSTTNKTKLNTSATKPPATQSKNDHSDLFNDDFDLNAAIDELALATTDEKFKDEFTPDKKEKSPPPDKVKQIPTETTHSNVFTTDAYGATEASSVADIINEMEDQLTSNTAKTEDNNVDDKYNADDEFDFIELNNLDFENSNIQEVVINKDTEENILDEEKLFNQVDLSDFKDSENVIIEKLKQKAREEKVPIQLRNNVEYLQSITQHQWHPLTKIFTIIVLLIISTSQLAYFRAYEMINLVPSTRPLIETFCNKIACRYSGPRNTKHIELLRRDVLQHPKEKKALLISVSMINNAHFKQPYPNIQIRLSDVSGNVVAERIFKSETYMGNISNPFLLMKSKVPVHMNFEVVDPEVYPINFEFRFL